jgi:hypothetical protein
LVAADRNGGCLIVQSGDDVIDETLSAPFDTGLRLRIHACVGAAGKNDGGDGAMVESGWCWHARSLAVGDSLIIVIGDCGALIAAFTMRAVYLLYFPFRFSL